MTDIVERLRRLASQQDMLVCEDMLQAADEIERLQGLLSEMRTTEAMAELQEQKMQMAEEIARLRAGLKYLAANSHDVEACAYAHALLLGDVHDVPTTTWAKAARLAADRTPDAVVDAIRKRDAASRR